MSVAAGKANSQAYLNQLLEPSVTMARMERTAV